MVFEALSLLETFRGRAIELESLTSKQRLKRAFKAEKLRKKRYFGMSAPGEDYSALFKTRSLGRISGPAQHLRNFATHGMR
jgi:hypothetical protein